MRSDQLLDAACHIHLYHITKSNTKSLIPLSFGIIFYEKYLTYNRFSVYFKSFRGSKVQMMEFFNLLSKFQFTTLFVGHKGCISRVKCS